MSAQADRDQMVAAFLDLTLEQWLGWARGLTDVEMAAMTATGLDQLAADVISSLQDQAGGVEDGGASRATYLRAMAAMADATMAWFVREVTS